jgi:hypothetical protein
MAGVKKRKGVSASNYYPPKGIHDKIGFYGCSRVVSVEWHGTGRPPASTYVDCPCGCGFRRLVVPLWRNPKSGERGELDIVAR